jgi:hypothetical protein
MATGTFILLDNSLFSSQPNLLLAGVNVVDRKGKQMVMNDPALQALIDKRKPDIPPSPMIMPP